MHTIDEFLEWARRLSRREREHLRAELDAISADEAEPGSAEFWSEVPVDELARRQGVRPARFEELLGAAAELWEDDADFDRFVKGIYQRRREERDREADRA